MRLARILSGTIKCNTSICNLTRRWRLEKTREVATAVVDSRIDSSLSWLVSGVDQKKAMDAANVGAVYGIWSLCTLWESNNINSTLSPAIGSFTTSLSIPSRIWPFHMCTICVSKNGISMGGLKLQLRCVPIFRVSQNFHFLEVYLRHRQSTV